jgi:hypothetical protein
VGHKAGKELERLCSFAKELRHGDREKVVELLLAATQQGYMNEVHKMNATSRQEQAG